MKTHVDRIITGYLLSIVIGFFFKAVLDSPLLGLIAIAFIPLGMRMLGYPMFEIDEDNLK